MNETPIESDRLPIKTVELETLEKPDLIRLLMDKTKAEASLANSNTEITHELNKLRETYNKDMAYMAKLVDNVVAKNKQKENAILALLQGITSTIMLDRTDVLPKEEETKND